MVLFTSSFWRYMRWMEFEVSWAALLILTGFINRWICRAFWSRIAAINLPTVCMKYAPFAAASCSMKTAISTVWIIRLPRWICHRPCRVLPCNKWCARRCAAIGCATAFFICKFRAELRRESICFIRIWSRCWSSRRGQWRQRSAHRFWKKAFRWFPCPTNAGRDAILNPSAAAQCAGAPNGA